MSLHPPPQDFLAAHPQDQLVLPLSPSPSKSVGLSWGALRSGSSLVVQNASSSDVWLPVGVIALFRGRGWGTLLPYMSVPFEPGAGNPTGRQDSQLPPFFRQPSENTSPQPAITSMSAQPRSENPHPLISLVPGGEFWKHFKGALN